MFLVVILFSLIIVTNGETTISKTNINNYVNCIVAILEKELTPSVLLIITFYNTTPQQTNKKHILKVKDEFKWMPPEEFLIKKLHNSHRWPTIHISSKQKDKTPHLNHGCSYKNFMYIIFLYSEGKNEEVMVQLHVKVLSLERQFCWNARSKFIVAVMQEKSENYPEETIKKVLEYLFARHVVNVIIFTTQIKMSFSLKSKEYGNTNEDMYILYSWFPYNDPKHCTTVGTPAVLDIWSAKDGGKFSKGSPLFPAKIGYNLSGCKLRLVTVLHPTVVNSFISTNESGTVVYSGGTGMVALEAITTSLNFIPHFIAPPNTWGDQIPNTNNWTGVLGMISRDEVDVAFGAPGIILEWNSVVDYTIPYHSGNLVWWVPCAQAFPRWKSIRRIFSPNFWLILFISIIVAGIVMRGFSKSYESISLRENSYKNLITCLTYSWAVLLGIAVPTMPRKKSLRMFFLSWVAYCLAVNTVFQTKLTSFLIDPGLEHQITTVEEMLESDLKLGVRNELTKNYILKIYSRYSLKPERILILEINDAIERMSLEGDISYIEGENIIDTIRSLYVDEDGRHRICQIEERLLAFLIGYIIPKGSPLRDVLSKVWRRLFEGNFVSLWLRSLKEFLYMKSAFKSQLKSEDEEYCPLGIEHLQGSFYLLLFGEAMCIVVLLLEILARYYFRYFQVRSKQHKNIFKVVPLHFHQ